jgi:TP901 family phage tail tape measure protein
VSEFIAEATVLVRPDTTKFRALLQAQLAAATKGASIPIPVAPVVAPGAVAAQRAVAAVTGATTGAVQAQTLATRELTTSIAALVGALAAQAAAEEAAGIAAAQNAVNVNKASSTLGRFRSGVTASLASLTGLRGAVLAASGPFLAAAVASAALLKSLGEFAKFEQQLNIFAATVEATGQEMEEVSALARELGADLSLPAVSATDAAIAMTELGKAGLSVEDAMSGARGVLQLSTAAGISVAEAAQFAANELNAFGLAGEQATHVADILTNAANSAQGSISDFGLAFKQSAAVANLVGLTLEDTAAQLAVLARAGLQGSDAGTSLRVALLRLINPTKEASRIIKELGINLRDAQGNIRPDVFVQFGEATRAFSKAQRDAAFAAVFGAEAIRTVSIAAEGGREALAEATIAIGEQGSAAEQAEARTAGFGGQLEALQSTASTTAVSLGEVSTVLAGPLVVGLTGVANLLNQVLEPFAELVRLTKQKLGLGTFDPATKSAAELMAEVRRLQDEFGNLRTASAEAIVQGAIRDAIRALENERAVLKALGIDVTGINVLIQRLQADLRATGETGVSAATAMEQEFERLKALIADIKLSGDVVPPRLTDALQALQQQIANAANEGGRFTERFDRGLRNAATAADILGRAIGRLRGEFAAANDELLDAQIAGASPQAQISILQGQISTKEQEIAKLRADGIGPGDPTAIRAAKNEILRIQNEIESLQAGIVSDQKAATAAAETHAKEAQAARDKQFQALADLFGGRQEDIENQIERAGIKGNVEKQIRLTKALIESLKRERAALIERLRALKVSNEVRKKILGAITDAIEEAQQDILRFQESQQEGIRNITENIDLRIRIAQARENEAAEIALRRKKVEIISKELARLRNAHKKGTKEWLELRAQLAEENKAIRDLQEDQDKDKSGGKSAQQFFFEQLQAQQGFAANLLGNLITGPTAGLVGVPSTTTTPGVAVDKAARQAEAGKGLGPTSGQAQTTNTLLERILAQLKSLNGTRDHPEATHQRAVGSPGMDGAGNISGI